MADFVGPDASMPILRSRVHGEQADRFQLLGDGTILKGDGSGSLSVESGNGATPPQWATKTGYKAGQVVVRAGRLLRAKTDHTSSNTYGGFNAANWTDTGPADTSTPTWLHLRGSATGADTYDSTSHVTIESHQRPSTGPYGESLRLWNMRPQSKSMISWWHAQDPTQPADEATNPMRPDVWVGAHYGAQDDADGIHGHWSVEVPDSGGDLRSRFGIDWINNFSGTAGGRGADKTSSYFANTDLSHRQGDGAVFRIASGAGSAERVIEFNASGQQPGVPPGYFDTTKRRWWLVTDQAAESGSDAGSDFLLRRFTDAGVANGTVLYSKRSTGNITFGQAADMGAAVAIGGRALASQHGFYARPSSISSGFAAFASYLPATTDRAFAAQANGDAQARLAVFTDGKIEWGDGTAARDTNLYRISAAILGSDHAFSPQRILIGGTSNGYVELREQASDPAAPSTDRGRLFTKDNGAGKTQLCVRFPTGAVQVIATEP